MSVDTPSGVVRQEAPTMYFIGVTTGGSSIMRLFPEWGRILGLTDARLVGVDLPLHADPARYRQVVLQIREDPLSLGALVTSHKLGVLEAARDLFDELDRYALLCREVSNIAKRDGRVLGFAKDPITAGRTLAEMLPADYWSRTDAHVLCLGAGGATAALAAHLLSAPDRPARFVAVNRSQRGLDNLRSVVGQLGASVEVEYILNEDPRRNDRLLGALPAGSLAVNATGMGKDLPGSPITDEATFPERAVVWELNYRGELAFLHQARRQAEHRQLDIHDGWRYFIHGWAEHVAEVFAVPLDEQRFEHLARAAEAYRPPA